MLITFEGLDFCGKSTQVELLKNHFEKVGKKVNLIREPGGVRISEKIRELLLDTNNSEMYPQTELLLFAASRSQLVRESILPLLNAGQIVLSDRFHDSSIAYQGFGREIDREFVIELQKFAIGDAIPDITFFIDIPVEESLKRKKLKGHDALDRIEVSETSFYERVRNGYIFLSKQEERFITIDGLMKIEEIHNEIKRHLKNLEERVV